MKYSIFVVEKELDKHPERRRAIPHFFFFGFVLAFFLGIVIPQKKEFVIEYKFFC